MVVNDASGLVKFGITSGDPRPRLKRHARDGFRRILRTIVDLPGGVARDLEQFVMASLKMAGMTPAKGVEYFEMEALNAVLAIVDGFAVPDRGAMPQQLALDFDAAA